MIRRSIGRLLQLAGAVTPYDGRIHGTTYPNDERAPEGSLRLLDWALFAVQRLRAKDGDVLVVRGEMRPETVGPLATALGKHGVTLAILPHDCRVHLEPRRLRGTDLGYRETASYGADKGEASEPQPGAPTTGVHGGLVHFLSASEQLEKVSVGEPSRLILKIRGRPVNAGDTVVLMIDEATNDAALALALVAALAWADVMVTIGRAEAIPLLQSATPPTNDGSLLELSE